MTPSPSRLPSEMTNGGDAYRGLPRTPAVEALRDRHLAFFRALVRRARDAELGRERDLWIEVIDSEVDNLRAALAWALERRDADAAMDLASSCLRLWQRGRHGEGRLWLARALAIEASPSPERVRALEALALLERGDAVFEWADEALAVARELGDDASLATALRRAGWANYSRSRFEEARAAFEEAVARGRPLPDLRPQVSDALRGLAHLHVDEGDAEAANALYDEAVAHVSGAGFEGALAFHLGQRAYLCWYTGDHAVAEGLYRRKLELEDAPGLSASRADTVLNLANVKLAQGRRTEARALWNEVIRLAEASGSRSNILRAELQLAYLDLREAELEEAQARVERCFGIVRDSDDPRDEFPNNFPLLLLLDAFLAEHDGDLTRATARLEQRVSAASRRSGRALALVPLAQLVGRHGEPDRRLALLREALGVLRDEPTLAQRNVPSALAAAEGDPRRALELYQVGPRRDLVRRSRAAVDKAELALAASDTGLVRELVADGLGPAERMHVDDEVQLRHLLARAALADGDLAAATTALTTLLPRWPEVGVATDWVDLVESIGRVLIGVGRADRGAELLGLADAERERIAYPRDDRAKADMEVAAETARIALGDGAFEAARGRGRSMDIRTELWKEAGR